MVTLGPDFLRLMGGLALVCLLSSCASRLPTSSSRGRPVAQKTLVGSLEGAVPTTLGSFISLKEWSASPFVLIFAAESCSSCRQETEALLARFRNQGGIPKNVRLLTVVLGVTPQQARTWAASFSSPVLWDVGVDESLMIYLNYFAEIQTPSILVGNGSGIFRVHAGPVPMAILEEESGKWEF